MSVLADALEHLVRGIVDHPDDVRVDLVTNRRGRTLEVRVHPEDLGKVIGRGGRTATALRMVVNGVAGPRLGPARPGRSTAGAVTTTVHHTTGSPVVIGEVPATSSVDRPSPPKSARTGQTSADTGTATTTARGALVHSGDLHPGDRGPGRDRVEDTRRLRGRRSASTPGLFYREPRLIPGTPRERPRSQQATHQPDLTQRDRSASRLGQDRNRSSPWHCPIRSRRRAAGRRGRSTPGFGHG